LKYSSNSAEWVVAPKQSSMITCSSSYSASRREADVMLVVASRAMGKIDKNLAKLNPSSGGCCLLKQYANPIFLKFRHQYPV
jgi:hypothetical protein